MLDEQNPLVSIIVPVYKVEQYLDRCVQSIISQTYKNIEVFLVDDGSPDNCGKMCDEYAEKNPCIHVIHQENQGLSAARNNAVPYTKGDYLTFIDSDDYVHCDYVGYLVNLLIKTNADISICRNSIFYETQEGKKADVTDDTYELLTPVETLKRMCYTEGFSVSAWAKMYKRELVEKYPYPVGKLYEDLATTYKMIGESNRVCYGGRVLYYWFQRKGGITNGEISDKQLYGVTAAEGQLGYIKKNFPEAEAAGKARCVAKILDLIPKTLSNKNNRAYFDILRNKLLTYYDDFINDRRVRKSLRYRGKAVKYGYLASKVVFKIHSCLKYIAYK